MSLTRGGVKAAPNPLRLRYSLADALSRKRQVKYQPKNKNRLKRKILAMTYTTQNDIAPGQLTLHRGNVFIAALRDGLKPCIEQCDCRLPGKHDPDRCDGFCLRWRNSKDVVFHALPDEAATQATVVETPFMAAIRQAKEQEKQTNKI